MVTCLSVYKFLALAFLPTCFRVSFPLPELLPNGWMAGRRGSRLLRINPELKSGHDA